MDSEKDLVLVDTNIFVIDLRYKRDLCFQTNRAFLDKVGLARNGFTTVVNLLELCGILSFNLNQKQLAELWFYFEDRYDVTVFPAPSLESKFPEIEIKALFDLLKRRTPLGDALMISVAGKFLPFVSTMVSWDKLHFENIFSGSVLTPEEYLSLAGVHRIDQ